MVTEPRPGDRVIVPWGFRGHAEAEVVEVYGPTALRHVLVQLSPDISGRDLLDEPTTLSLPVESVEQVETT